MSTPVPSQHRTSAEALARFSASQIQQAGNRYTPCVDPSAPNLRINDLFVALDNAACGEAALRRFTDFHIRLREATAKVEHYSQDKRALNRYLDTVSVLPTSLLPRLRLGDSSAKVDWQTALNAIENRLGED